MSTQDDIKEIREEFERVDLAIIDGAKNMRTLQASLSRTNAIMGSKNWEVFSRFISGTGLWRVQNRIKATVILLNEMASSTERRRLEEVKQLKVYAEIAEQSEEIQKIQANLEKAESGTGKVREKALKDLKGQSKIFGGLLFQYQDQNKALKEMGKLMTKQVKDMETLERTATRTARRRREGLIANSLTIKLLTAIKKKGDGIFKTQKDIATTKMTEGMEKLKGQFDEYFGNTMSKDLKDQFANLGKGFTGEEEFEAADPTKSKSRNRIAGKMVDKKTFAEFKKLREKVESEKDAKKGRRSLLKMAKVVTTPVTNMAKFLGRIAKGIALVVKSMLIAAGYLLLVMLILTLLKSIFDETKDELILGFNKIKEVFSIGMAMVSSGLADAKSAIQAIFTAFKEGDLVGVVFGVGELLLAGLKVLGGLLVATLGAVFAGIGTYFLELGRTGYDAIFKATGNAKAAFVGGALKIISVVMRVVAAVAFLAVFFGGGWIAVLVGAVAVVLYKIAETIYDNLDKIFFSISLLKVFASSIINILEGIPEQIGNFIGDKFKEAMDVGGNVKDKVGGAFSSAKNFIGLAEGGRVSRSGLAIVGERGPELVQLPRGAQVHSNTASKAMSSSVTNHITVQVTGRVGASDTEIKDIANKVAREINSRMNRTATSVVKF